MRRPPQANKIGIIKAELPNVGAPLFLFLTGLNPFIGKLFVKKMNPVGLEIIYYKDNRAYGPGKRISPEDNVDLRDKVDDDGDVSDT